jgi:hypothetical protein
LRQCIRSLLRHPERSREMLFLATIYGINLCAVEPCRGVIADARCRAFRARQGLAKHYLSLRDPKMLSHFARKNAQFVARFYSFDYETSHRDVSAAQGDAGVWALILNPPINQNLKCLKRPFSRTVVGLTVLYHSISTTSLGARDLTAGDQESNLS